MGKRLPYTPKSRVRSALRQVWLRSRERAAALKRDHYQCQDCGIRQSTRKGHIVKVEVDHLDGIEWNKILEYIYRHILVDPSKLETVCRPCHQKRTRERK